MKSIKKFFVIVGLLMIGTFAFADDWFVCVGSYSSTDNAAELVQSLQNKGVSTFIYEITKDNGSKLYRVLVNEPFKSRDAARDSRDALETSTAIKALRLSGLWICQAQAPVADVIESVKTPEPVAPAPAPVEAEEPAAASDEYIKVVLEWKDQSIDLDSVMTTSEVFIDYDNPEEYGMTLSFDEDADYAPETISIKFLNLEETYSYYVILYSDYATPTGSEISNSGANVKIYANGSCIATFDVEPGCIGTTWHVFDIIPGGSISAIDEINNEELYY